MHVVHISKALETVVMHGLVKFLNKYFDVVVCVTWRTSDLYKSHKNLGKIM